MGPAGVSGGCCSDRREPALRHGSSGRAGGGVRPYPAAQPTTSCGQQPAAAGCPSFAVCAPRAAARAPVAPRERPPLLLEGLPERGGGGWGALGRRGAEPPTAERSEDAVEACGTAESGLECSRMRSGAVGGHGEREGISAAAAAAMWRRQGGSWPSLPGPTVGAISWQQHTLGYPF